MLKVNMFSILIKSEVMRKAPPRPDMLPSPGLGRRPSHKRSRCFLVDSWSCGSHPCSHRAVDRSKAEAASALYIWGKVQRGRLQRKDTSEEEERVFRKESWPRHSATPVRLGSPVLPSLPGSLCSEA